MKTVFKLFILTFCLGFIGCGSQGGTGQVIDKDEEGLQKLEEAREAANKEMEALEAQREENQ